jgi:hypothetical protein
MKHAAYIVVLLLVGCDQLHSSDPTRTSAAARYQIVANSEGGAWKLDVITGEMKICHSFAPVASGPICYKAVEK